MVIVMPESNLDKIKNVTELWALLVVVLSGAIGGCSAAFSSMSDKKKFITFLSVMGYSVVGIFGALIAFTISSSMSTDFYQELRSIILISLLTGFSTAIGLLSTNLGFRIILKKLGIELQINVTRTKNKKDKE